MLRPGRNYVGASLRLTVRVYDGDDADADPLTLSCKVMSPNGTIYTYTYGEDSEIGRTDEGDYYCDVTPDVSGRWLYRWLGTDTNITVVDEGSFRVDYSSIIEDAAASDYS